MNRSQRHAGFTLIELLIVIGIIAVLVGMLMPAVTLVREAARRATCQSNMRQIGIAAHSYIDAHGALPVVTEGEGSLTSWSIHVHLLVYIDPNVAKMVDMENRPYGDLWNDLRALDNKSPVWTCPSDPKNDGTKHNAADRHCTNYFVSWGTWGYISGWDGPYGPMGSSTEYNDVTGLDEPKPFCVGGTTYVLLGGIVPKERLMFSPVRLDDIRDGQSNTALFSEGRIGGGDAAFDRKSRFGTYPFRHSGPGIENWVGFKAFKNTSLEFARDDMLAFRWQDSTSGYQITDSDSRIDEVRGTWYGSGELFMTGYYHLLPPNSPSYFYYDKNRFFLEYDYYYTANASSYHPNGVNVLLCDGSVTYVTNDIDPATWTAYGSRAGND